MRDATEWEHAEDIANLPQVDELLQDFADDPTGDNGIMIVREVIRAMQSQAQQPARMQFLDRSKEKIITLLWQGICDGTVDAFDVNGMMVIPSEQGVTYVRKEDAISFFGLVEPSQAQQESKLHWCGTCEQNVERGCGDSACQYRYKLPPAPERE